MKTLFQPKTLFCLCTAAALTTAAASALAAPVSLDVTRGAVAVTTTMGQFADAYAVKDLIDQSGLSSSYVSGSTNFDSYTATAIHSGAKLKTTWYSRVDATRGFLSFDLGSTYSIDGLAWFGDNPNAGSGVNHIKVYADSDADPLNGSAGLLFDSGIFSAREDSMTDFVLPNLFSFSSITNTRYINIEIVSNRLEGGFSSAGEVVFRQSLDAPAAAVPEPQSLALAGLGLLALGVTRRRVTKR